MSVSIRNSAGGTVALFSVTMPDGSQSIAHVLVDGNSIPYSASNPLLTAPAIYSVAFTSYPGTIVTAGATALDIPADPTRKGGTIRAGRGNGGLITITLKDASGNTHAEQIGPGDGYALTVGGYVIQDEITISGDTPGDTFSGVTYQ